MAEDDEDFWHWLTSRWRPSGLKRLTWRTTNLQVPDPYRQGLPQQTGSEGCTLNIQQGARCWYTESHNHSAETVCIQGHLCQEVGIKNQESPCSGGRQSQDPEGTISDRQIYNQRSWWLARSRGACCDACRIRYQKGEHVSGKTSEVCYLQ